MAARDLTEQETRTRYITPAIQRAGWEPRQITEEVNFTDGPVIVRGQLTMRGRRKKADYILYYTDDLPLAVVEAKKWALSVSTGLQQALDYAAALDIPFVYSSNGQGFVEHDRHATTPPVERELPIDQFPSPQALWDRYRRGQHLDPAQETAVTAPFFYTRDGKRPRYYQRIAVKRTVAAIARGQKRILLVMATGTGKTYTAFQIAWLLRRTGQAKRILYLADRNVLIDQAMVNDFRHFGDVMTKVTNRTVDKAFEVYMALYQGLTGKDETQNIFREFSPDFFDLIIVDECHRGSAADDSAWRQVLDHYAAATHIGLTATPKETKDVSNIDYFGEPVYTYSLKQGIADGFLAPYKIMRVRLDIDETGYQPDPGETDRYGQELPDVAFGIQDFDRTLVIDERTQMVAKRITEYLRATDRFHKTIVFCRDIDHAERMRVALVNENADLVAQNHKYVMRITGDSAEGKRELDNFIAPDETYPVIATTSKLMTTGVDAQTCKLIVLDTIINSMTEFKQIIGRGTRIREDFGKRFFTIMDFRDATRLFEDPDFDGEPVQIIDVGPDQPAVIREPGVGDDGYTVGGGGLQGPPGWGDDDSAPALTKYYIDGVPVQIASERVQYRTADGKLVTETFEAFSRRNFQRAYGSLHDFLTHWQAADRKEAILAELMEEGVLLDELAAQVGLDIDPFDLICHIAFDQPPLTRQERADNVRKRNYFGQYGPTARRVLEALLEKYADNGISPLEDAADGHTSRKVLQLQPFNQIGTPTEIANAFGGPQAYMQAVRELERQIYAA